MKKIDRLKNVSSKSFSAAIAPEAVTKNLRKGAETLTGKQSLLILAGIWLLGAVGDRLWFILDHAPPSWDRADYLNGAMNYWQALQSPQWFNGEWWRNFWLLSSKIPPLTYIATSPFFHFFGVSADTATLLLLVYSAILLLSIYGLGVLLFNNRIALWAAGICQLLPGLYRYRLEFLLDYPVTAVVTCSFFCLTLWKVKSKPIKPVNINYFPENPPEELPPRSKFQKFTDKYLNGWVCAIFFGLSFGVAMMVKQTSLLFLITPLIWIFLSILFQRHWERIAQLLVSFGISTLIFGWWYRTNWLLILTSGKRATLDSAIAEGDPALNTIHAWVYYWKILPYLLSWHLLIVPIVGLIVYGGRKFLTTDGRRWTRISYRSVTKFIGRYSLVWIGVFFFGGYLFSSLNINKDARYILPILPVLSLFLAAGLLAWRGRWQNEIRWGTIGLALLLAVINFFPIDRAEIVTNILSPRVQHRPYLGKEYPHEEVIAEIIKQDPYLQTTLAVLPSTSTINQHNFSFYGAKANFQVYGRQVGVREKEVVADGRSLDWFIVKTGEQGSVPEAQAQLVDFVEGIPAFRLETSWKLPDEDSDLILYHRKKPSVEVKPISGKRETVQLDRITIPEVTPPGVPVPVKYEWSGPWEKLKSGLVLLTWGWEDETEIPVVAKFTDSNPRMNWLHDRAIAMGRLTAGSKNPQPEDTFRVIERTAMLPDANILPGTYRLEALYLNRETGESYPIPIPETTIQIDPEAEPTPAPELDLITQLRTVAPNLAEGVAGLEPIFELTARINQYDPIQDYLNQAEQALAYRLDRQYLNLDWAYSLVLAQILQQNVEGAIASLEKVIQLDSDNPYNYAYLALVYLYDWRPFTAEEILEKANSLNPNLEIVQILSGVAAFMQGHLVKAWQILSPLINNSQ
ncbi:phospholipid carrier-dependent glycosyltransferase [Oscillatoria salina]|uniref:phospholipid carrier-dependent glycosyltransferase n=1 Tax=Oscillatoria salina TaxID=331517 RepID=UPI001CCBC93E|nr:phospholipid carrier-dependent glycosyltransferase [Oscillatoria salina]